jgi:hypothetical protein
MCIVINFLNVVCKNDSECAYLGVISSTVHDIDSDDKVTVDDISNLGQVRYLKGFLYY